MSLKDILCTACNKHRAQKLCRRCPKPGKFCLMCWANTHEKLDHGEPKTLCVDCFSEPAAVECDACTGKICKKCIADHMAACQCSSSDDDGPMSEDEASELNHTASADGPTRSSSMSDDCINAQHGKPDSIPGSSSGAGPHDSKSGIKRVHPICARSGDADARPAKQSRAAPKTAGKKPQKAAKEPKKVAEVVSDTAAAAADRPEVGENIMNRIKKALALGLHCGGHDAEKKHAMQRATRLMQQYGLSQADVANMSAGDVESASGMVKVRLNGNYVQWPAWGRTVLSIARSMSNTKCFTTRGDTGKKVCFAVTFYGLKADAVMAANIFEVAYNSVIHLAAKEMRGKGARAMLDYRQGMVRGLYVLAQDDKKEREKALEAARAAVAAQGAVAAVKPGPQVADVKPGPQVADVKPGLAPRDSNARIKVNARVKVKPEAGAAAGDDPLDDDGMPWQKVKPEVRECGGRDGMARELGYGWTDGEEGGYGENEDGYGDNDEGYWDDYDDVGDDEDGDEAELGREKENAGGMGAGAAHGSAGKATPGSSKGESAKVMQQMVLYDDKAKLAFEAVEKKLKIQKGRKVKAQIKDLKAYNKGKKDASKVNLGAKQLTDKSAAGVAGKGSKSKAAVK